jgi:cupin fold WbuC family metalloprotein
MHGVQTSLRIVSPEVLYSDGGFRAVDGATVALLKEMASASPRHRGRVCFHADADAVQQEMLIVMHASSYVRPHRHLDKSETLTVIEGTAEAVLFDPDGNVSDIIAMSDSAGGGSFFYRMPAGVYHTLVFGSEWLVFLETTTGPFDRARTELAPWAPAEADPVAGRAYLDALRRP